MGNSVRRFTAFVPPDEEMPEEPLGEAISGLFAGMDVDSVEAVRELRRRE
jgi:hypothetical protein